jgi:DNA-binding GntR family transcriptional regulator
MGTRDSITTMDAGSLPRLDHLAGDAPYRTKRDVAAGVLRSAIIRGEMPAGTRLLLNQLAQQLGLSLTPVREAIQQLEAEGFVELQNHKGGVVLGLDSEDLLELYAMRAGVEGLAARIGAPKLTEDDLDALQDALHELQQSTGPLEERIPLDMAFHTILYQAAGSERWMRTIQTLRQRSMRYVMASSESIGSESIDVDHRALLRACRDRDGVQAQEVIQRHLTRARDILAAATELRGAMTAEPVDVGAVKRPTRGRATRQPPE